MLTETIARHFDDAQISEDGIDLGVADLHISCWVDGVREIGDSRSASLFFQLWGGKLGETPIVTSMSGYGDSVEEAIITGGCNWGCTFGPVLVAALTSTEPEEAEVLEALVHGREMRAVVDGLDRGMFQTGEEEEIFKKLRVVREHLGGTPWLIGKALSSDTLPALPSSQATIVGLFICESEDSRTVEIKVNGCNWPPSQSFLDEVPFASGPGSTFLREFAVLVPSTDSPPSRDLLGSTLAGLSQSVDERTRNLVAWPGWEAHGGQLGEPTSKLAVDEFESQVVALPDTYREFLLGVEEAGAGPGYGLISPFGEAQRAMAKGKFNYVDGQEPTTPPEGCLLLAHAGCGNAWLLVVAGKHRGEVWIDPVGSDAIARRVAPDFGVWYQDWIDALVRNDSVFSQWDAACCATPSTISAFLESRKSEGTDSDAAMEELAECGEGSMSIAAVGDRYFNHGEQVGPCQPCVELTLRMGMRPGLFKPGKAPKQARPGTVPKRAPHEPKQGLLGRLAKRLTK